MRKNEFFLAFNFFEIKTEVIQMSIEIIDRW